jgi:hypothetical protein
MNVEI